ncbi:MAG: hypothetical protein LBT41_05670 [Candidatus Methanoplasma sp.]|jgi:glucose/mannose-6-phosphate isomerase|nr:hypothetical protein [Candidatus Methanoplasma sp.]
MTKTTEPDKYRQAAMLPEHIEESLRTLSALRLPPELRVCIFGVGASALAADVLSDYADGASRSPIYVIRGTELPGWADESTAVIAVSYSGDTCEVLDAYEKAHVRGCKIACITSGGKLLEKCASNGDRAVRLPPGLVSRDAFGYIIGSIAAVIEAMGVCKAATDLEALIPELKRHRDEIVDKGYAQDMAMRLLDRIPVIYSLGSMRSSAIRWKAQINENTEFLSFCGSLPEFNHNEIVGWTGDCNSELFVPVVIYDENASQSMKNMTDTSMDILTEKGFDIVTYTVSGSGNLEKNLKCILMGDLVSIKMACVRRTITA